MPISHRQLDALYDITEYLAHPRRVTADRVVEPRIIHDSASVRDLVQSLHSGRKLC